MRIVRAILHMLRHFEDSRLVDFLAALSIFVTGILLIYIGYGFGFY